MLPRSFWFVVVGVSLFLDACDAQTQGDREPFLPLAGIAISIAPTQVDSFLINLRSFAAARNLSVEEGNFPKQGLKVINMSVRLNDETFFHVDNFRDPTKFELNAYSHQSQEIWKPIWVALVKTIETEVGPQNIEKTFPK
jgi:hypothetical protein